MAGGKPGGRIASIFLWAARGSRSGPDWDRLGSVPNLSRFKLLLGTLGQSGEVPEGAGHHGVVEGRPAEGLGELGERPRRGEPCWGTRAGGGWRIFFEGIVSRHFVSLEVGNSNVNKYLEFSETFCMSAFLEHYHAKEL